MTHYSISLAQRVSSCILVFKYQTINTFSSYLNIAKLIERKQNLGSGRPSTFPSPYAPECSVPTSLVACVTCSQLEMVFQTLELNSVFPFFLRFYLFIFRERGRETERKEEKHPCVIASLAPPTGDLVCKPGMCPDWELNRQPFASQSSAQSTEPNQPGWILCFLKVTMPLVSALPKKCISMGLNKYLFQN